MKQGGTRAVMWGAQVGPGAASYCNATEAEAKSGQMPPEPEYRKQQKPCAGWV